MSQPARRTLRSEDPREQNGDRRLRFGDFELDAASGELFRDGSAVTIQPQPAKVLTLLAERPGAIVSRRELQTYVWGDEHFVDYEQGLNYCIKAVRRVLGDNARDPRYIETIPKRGYRFRLPVHRVDDRPHTIERTEPALPRTLGAIGAGIALAIGAIALVTIAPRASLPNPSDVPRLAVLPLRDYDSASDPVLEGLTDELIARLSQTYQGQLGVIARSSSSLFDVDLARAGEIGAALGADYLLIGSVRRLGETTRVAARLVRTDDEVNVWADMHDNDASAADWRDWTRRVTADVGATLSLAADAVVPDEPSPEIYDRYLEGVYYANASAPETRARGLELMESILAVEPDFPSALLVWSRLARELTAPTEFRPVVAERLRHAIAIDPRSAEAHLELARLQLLNLRDPDGAARSVERALDLSPRLARAHHTHAMVLSAQGRHGEAFDAMRRALVFDPLSAELVSHSGWAHFLARQYDRAIEHARRALEMEPGSPVARSCILFSALEMGDEAVALEQARRLTGRDLDSLEHYWLTSLEALVASARERGFTHGTQAFPLIHLDRQDEAMAVLLRACAEGASWPIAFSSVDPRLDPLREHPRFNDLLECAGLAGAPSV